MAIHLGEVVVANLEDFDEGSQNRSHVGFGVPTLCAFTPYVPPLFRLAAGGGFDLTR